MFKHLIICISIVFLAFSCSPRITPAVTEQKDSIVNSYEKIRDSVIKIPRDSSFIRALLEFDSSRKIYIKELLSYKQGENLNIPEISIDNNVLSVKATTDYKELYLQLHDKYTELTLRSKTKETITVEVNKLYWYQEALIYVGIIALILLIITIIIKIK